MNNFVEIARHCNSHEEAIVALHDSNASPVYAIKALVEGRGLSLNDAKAMLMKSPSWSHEAENANRLHDQIEEALKDNGDELDE